MKSPQANLSLGPVLYNWSADIWRDFYFKIADEAPVDTVYVGEVVCSKRQPFFDAVIPDVIERLQSAGKDVVLSTLALVMTKRELSLIHDLAQSSDFLIEANDLSAVSLLKNKAHHIGPFINVYNEGTLEYLAGNGATRVCLPFELPSNSMATLASSAPKSVELEVQVFGKLPLAISARCYHARSCGLTKDSCQFVCADDPEGMAVKTLDGSPFLTVNGTQTLSNTCELLIAELSEMRQMGVSSFRLSPLGDDMVAVAEQYRAVLDGAQDTTESAATIAAFLPGTAFSNGFYHGIEGNQFHVQGE